MNLYIWNEFVLILGSFLDGLVSKWQGMASSKVINDFPGLFSSAYVLERPLLNQNLPNYGLNNVNSAIKAVRLPVTGGGDLAFHIMISLSFYTFYLIFHLIII